MKRGILLALLVLGVTAAGGPDAGVVDVTKKSGIDFRYTFGGKGEPTKIVEVTGPGVALFDADGDGYLDVYLVNAGWLKGISDDESAKDVKNHLYRNSGDWRFGDVTDKAGVGDRGYGMGCATADYDADGDVDLFVTNFGPNVLYRNRGDGTFEDVTEKAGVAGPEKLNGYRKWSTNAVFFDADGDGDLDLWVCNYLAFDSAFNEYYGPEGFPGPSSYLGQPSLLYLNNGDGTFRQLTEEAMDRAGLWRTDGRGMGASVVDLDGDGRPDLFEANDNMANHLFRNEGGGRFKEIAVAALMAYGQGGENTAAMHGSVGDCDGDGRFDVLVADANFSSLFMNQGGWIFLDASETSGLARFCGQYASWGGFFFDFDNDGVLDIFLANGGAHHLYGQHNLFLRGTPEGRFEDVSVSLNRRIFKAKAHKHTSRGAACGDLDNDGDLDVVVANIDRPGMPTIYENRAARGNHWIGFVLEGRPPNTQAFGAVVTVRAGDRAQKRFVQSAISYLSASDPRQHFGLGKAGKVARVEVLWPSGRKASYSGLEVDRYHTLREKE